MNGLDLEATNTVAQTLSHLPMKMSAIYRDLNVIHDLAVNDYPYNADTIRDIRGALSLLMHSTVRESQRWEMMYQARKGRRDISEKTGEVVL